MSPMLQNVSNCREAHFYLKLAQSPSWACGSQRCVNSKYCNWCSTVWCSCADSGCCQKVLLGDLEMIQGANRVLLEIGWQRYHSHLFSQHDICETVVQLEMQCVTLLPSIGLNLRLFLCRSTTCRLWLCCFLGLKSSFGLF